MERIDGPMSGMQGMGLQATAPWPGYFEGFGWVLDMLGLRQDQETGGAVMAPDSHIALSNALNDAVLDVGRKFDGGKAPLVQGCLAYFGPALDGVALVSAYGREKYKVRFEDKNWMRVDNAKGRYADALLRHLKAWASGESIDPENGRPHIDMVAWNALALATLEKQPNA